MRLTAAITITFLGLVLGFGQEQSPLLNEPFTSLRVSGNIHLQLLPTEDRQSIQVSGQDPEELDIETRDGQLILRAKTELSNSPVIEITLYYVRLSTVEITKGALIRSAQPITSQTLQLDVLSGGKAELTIQTDSLSARVNQGSDLILYGSTRSQYINAYTWGNVLADELEATDTYIKTATGAQVKVKAGKLLDAAATSGGYVGYYGEPEQKKFKTSVGGEITQLTE